MVSDIVIRIRLGSILADTTSSAALSGGLLFLFVSESPPSHVRPSCYLAVSSNNTSLPRRRCSADFSWEVDSETRRCASWSRFREGLQQGRHSSRPAPAIRRNLGISPEDIVPPPAFRSITTHSSTPPDARDPHSQRISVRSEYSEAERAAMSTTESDDVFLVSGKPGICLDPSLEAPSCLQNLTFDQQSHK